MFYVTQFQKRIAIFAIVLAGVLLLSASGVLRAQSPCGESIVVTRGDTLLRIARRCNTTVAQLLQSNPDISNPDVIFVGQVIELPNQESDSGDTPKPAVEIEPDSGPAGTIVDVVARNFPPNSDVVVGIGNPNSEAVRQFNTTANADGIVDTRIQVPTDAEQDESFVVVVFELDEDGARAISQIFNTAGSTSDQRRVSVQPDQAAAGEEVTLDVSGFAPDAAIEIGFGLPNSEYDVIALDRTNSAGELTRSVTVPTFADAGDEYLFVVLPQGTTDLTLSQPVEIIRQTENAEAQVEIAPTAGPADSNIQMVLSGFPPNTRVSYGLLRDSGTNFFIRYSDRTNSNGVLQTSIPVPAEANVGENYPVVAYVPLEREINARSQPFTVTGDRDSEGNNLFTRTNIYLVALEDGGMRGIEIGCGDSLVPVEVTIEPTIAPLTAALQSMFALDERFYGDTELYNALYRSELAVDGIDIDAGLATINLSGDLTFGGVCDEPRILAQIEETALQYSTISEVQILLDGEPLRLGR